MPSFFQDMAVKIAIFYDSSCIRPPRTAQVHLVDTFGMNEAAVAEDIAVSRPLRGRSSCNIAVFLAQYGTVVKKGR